MCSGDAIAIKKMSFEYSTSFAWNCAYARMIEREVEIKSFMKIIIIERKSFLGREGGDTLIFLVF
jgi:hypothetical protein